MKLIPGNIYIVKDNQCSHQFAIGEPVRMVKGSTEEHGGEFEKLDKSDSWMMHIDELDIPSKYEWRYCCHDGDVVLSSKDPDELREVHFYSVYFREGEEWRLLCDCVGQSDAEVVCDLLNQLDPK